MMKASITIEFLAGIAIEDAIEQASIFSNKMNIAYTKFNFNGVSMSVSAKATPKEGKSLYQQAIKETNGFVII
jgi:hypothetical protein